MDRQNVKLSMFAIPMVICYGLMMSAAEDVRKIVEKGTTHPEPVIGSGKFFLPEKKESRFEESVSEKSSPGECGATEGSGDTDLLADGRSADQLGAGLG